MNTWVKYNGDILFKLNRFKKFKVEDKFIKYYKYYNGNTLIRTRQVFEIIKIERIGHDRLIEVAIYE